MNHHRLKKYLRRTCFGILSGALAGLATALFLHTLKWATETREGNTQLVYFLPLGGLLVGLLYHRFGQRITKGHNLILEEIHDPQSVLPLRMAPFIYLGTIVTHLFGGSAGREGTAVQMSASLTDQLNHFFRMDADERKALLVAGTGAGFGAAIGAPWAGVIFGIEIINVGRLRLFALFECCVASFVAYYTAYLLHTPHTIYPMVEFPTMEWKTIFYTALAGVIFGISARVFVMLVHLVEYLQSKLIYFPPFRPVIAGVVLVVLYHLTGSYRYAGLGIPVIQDAFLHVSNFNDPLFKGFFTAITVGSGFKGGEFIPLVFIGATLGSFLGPIFFISPQLLAGIGFASVFAGAANAPIACAVMACELFGIKIAPYAFVGCLTSYYFSGHHGIYMAQRIHLKKHHRLRAILIWLGELPRRFMNEDGDNK